MSARWTAWHFFFGYLLRRRGPSSIEVLDEVRLSAEPPRFDYLLVRKRDAGDSAADDARTLHRLWPSLPRVSVVEYKSPGHPYRHADLDRLWGYVHLHFANQRSSARPRAAPRGETTAPREGDVAVSLPPSSASDIRGREDLCAVLILAKRTPSLDDDVASMGLRWEDRGDGYWRIRGGLFSLDVVEIDVAGSAEQDDVLTSLGHGKATTLAARNFWLEFASSKEVPMSVHELEGYEELLENWLNTLPPEMVMAHYKPEQRLAGLPPEQRLAGLDRDHAALALPLEVLRVLPTEYVQSLSPETQAEIRRRLGKNGHAG